MGQTIVVTADYFTSIIRARQKEEEDLERLRDDFDKFTEGVARRKERPPEDVVLDFDFSQYDQAVIDRFTKELRPAGWYFRCRDSGITFSAYEQALIDTIRTWPREQDGT